MAEEKKTSSDISGNDSPPRATHEEKGRKQSVFDIDISDREHLNAHFENPLAGVDDAQLMQDVETFCQQYDLMDQLDNMKKGAKISKSPNTVAEADYLEPAEKDVILREKTNKWDHPFMLYWLCTMCSLAAATQGMDETVNNGAVAIYTKVCE